MTREFLNSLPRKTFNLLPNSIKMRLIGAFYDRRIKVVRNKLLIYYSGREINDTDLLQGLNYIRSNGLHVFPYSFTEQYSPSQFEVCFDEDKGLPYVLYLNRRLYGKRGMDKKSMQFLNSGVLLEQDEQSPHRYLTNDFTVNAGDIVADVGVAEGNFGLSVVEKVSKLYLFEADESWIEPLNATFEPWKDKVQIINKRVSDIDDSDNVCLDSALSGNKLDFIKIDVDGGERKLLLGAKKILTSSQPIRVAICTYHNAQDADEFKIHFTDKGFKCEFSDKYMVFYYDRSLKAPFFRKGLLRAERS